MSIPAKAKLKIVGYNSDAERFWQPCFRKGFLSDRQSECIECSLKKIETIEIPIKR